jgi:uncharacterized protein (DUF58 family)
MTAIQLSLKQLIRLRVEAKHLNKLRQEESHYHREGLRTSHFKGRGMDFSEVRSYQEGDDIRRMDWRVTARTLTPHIKLYHPEREKPTMLMVDYNAPMFFGTKTQLKSSLAAKVAAILGWYSCDQGDQVNGMVYSGSQVTQHTTQAKHNGLLPLLNTLADTAYPPQKSEDDAFKHLLKPLFQGQFHNYRFYFLSDFYGFKAEHSKAFTRLAQHNELVLIQLYDPLEACLPDAHRLSFSDGQKKRSLLLSDTKIRQQYQADFNQRQQQLHSLSKHQAIHVAKLSTDTNTTQLRQQLLQVIQ